MVPFPLGRGRFVWGNPIWVGSRADLEAKRSELETELNEMTLAADAAVK